MGRLAWCLAFVVTFVLGLAAGRAAFKSPPVRVSDSEDVAKLQQQVTLLEARLRARDDGAQLRHASAPATSASSSRISTEDRVAAAALGEARGRFGRGNPAALQPVSTTSAGGSRPSPAAIEAARGRFYRYLELSSGADGRERWREAREAMQDLRNMGSAAVQALLQVLGSAADSEERRAAARMLGSMQAAEALPLFKDILDKEDDVLLRRAAAAGLRQLQTADAVPVMERMMTNPAEDRMVRLSAAAGLAQSGRADGVTGLAQIFQESTADGRGREMAFRALTGLNDERAVPFMRQVVSSPVEPSYRLEAIRYLSAQGDRTSLGVLSQLMQSPAEPQSLRDAARQAYGVISAR